MEWIEEIDGANTLVPQVDVNGPYLDTEVLTAGASNPNAQGLPASRGKGLKGPVDVTRILGNFNL